MQAKIDPARPLQEIAQHQRRPVAKPLAHYAERCAGRDQAIAAAYGTGAYSMQAIAEYFGISRMTVSRTVNRYETERSALRA
ncbi:MAG: helix-turn-helix domain-containing protein [Pseudomonadota bacterium]|nr:helix-turn-helix domain-containing protein [Pseudomonadota bacterium]